MTLNKLAILATLGILLTSCQTMSFDDEQTDVDPSKGEKTMHFRLSPYKMSNLNELTDSSDDDESYYEGDESYYEGEDSEDEYLARAAANNQNATDHLLLGIYDMDGNLVDSIIYQDKDDTSLPSYGTFSSTLKYGKYTLMALGWNGTQRCTVHRADSISFSEGWVPHTFLARQNIIVSEENSDTRTISLKRCVARFTLKLTDAAISSELANFRISISGGGSTLNSQTGYCAEQSTIERSLSVSNPSSVRSLTAYSFLPCDSTGLTVSIAAHDAEGNTLIERKFEDVPMKINWQTTYSGNLFSYTATESAIEFDTDYDGEINRTF